MGAVQVRKIGTVQGASLVAVIFAQPMMARRPICHNVVASNTPYYQGATSDTEMACQHVRGNRGSSVLACLEKVQ